MLMIFAVVMLLERIFQLFPSAAQMKFQELKCDKKFFPKNRFLWIVR